MRKDFSRIKNWAQAQPIFSSLQNLQKQIFVRFVLQSFLKILIWAILAFCVFSVIESFAFFEPRWKIGILSFILLGIVVLLGISILRYFKDFGENGRFSFPNLALAIGEKHPEIADKMLHAYDLSAHRDPNHSESLIEDYTKQVAAQIENHDFSSVLPQKEFSKILRLALGSLAIFILISVTMNEAMFRAINATTIHHPQAPFELKIQPGNIELPEGENLQLIVSADGELPISPQIEITQNGTISQNIPQKQGTEFVLEIPNLTHSFEYRAVAEPQHFWTAWNRVKTPIFTVTVLQNPEIASFFATITPPKYTGLPPLTQEGNRSEINAYAGSKIRCKIQSDKPLKSAFLSFESGDSIALSVNQFQAEAKFYATRNDQFSIHLEDVRNLKNTEPLSIAIQILEDAFPTVDLKQPAENLDIGDDFAIPIVAEIHDDFGFSALEIVYEIQHPDYLAADTLIYRTEIPLQNHRKTAQIVPFYWSFENLELAPDDAVIFHLELADNDFVGGPKWAKSEIRIARYPSILEMFEEMDIAEERTENDISDVIETVENIREDVQEMARELLKNPEMDWEDAQKAEQLVQAQEEIASRLEEIAESIQEMTERAEDQNLFSQDLVEKFAELQALFEEVLTPEMKEILRKIQEAVDEMDPQKLQEAMENFSATLDELNENLDRMLELFKRVQTEEEMNRLVQRLEEMLNTQSNLLEQLNRDETNTSEEFRDAATEENRLKNTASQWEEDFSSLQEMMSSMQVMPNDEMENIAMAMDEMQIPNTMQNAENALNQQNSEQSQSQMTQSRNKLSQLFAMMQSTQNSMQNNMMEELEREFSQALYSALNLSQNQEKLAEQIKQLQYRSPKLDEMAEKQMEIRSSLNSLAELIEDISKKTFFASPRLMREMGKSAKSMENALSKLEERNSNQAAAEGLGAMTQLNTVAQMLANSMDAMQNSGGSGTGFQQYLEQLEKMSQQQNALNQQSGGM